MRTQAKDLGHEEWIPGRPHVQLIGVDRGSLRQCRHRLPREARQLDPRHGSDSCQLTGSTYGDHCWWHWPASVNPTPIAHGETPSCVLHTDCGMGVITYAAGAADPGSEPIALPQDSGSNILIFRNNKG